MSAFHEMLHKISSSKHHDNMQRTARLLDDHFGINHFWYYRITSEGNYCFLGTHTKWSEYTFDMSLLQQFPCLRHPDTLLSGISLMKSCQDPGYRSVLKQAWDHFKINFSINLMEKIPEGVEAFGFATRHGDPKADERLLNELPLLRQFTSVFRERHHKLFDLLYDNQVNIAAHIGPIFYEVPKRVALPVAREEFLCKIGMKWIYSLTPRERDILNLLSKGYPASFIALQLKLSPRTVENYMVILKDKLSCNCKAELIQKANNFVSLT